MTNWSQSGVTTDTVQTKVVKKQIVGNGGGSVSKSDSRQSVCQPAVTIGLIEAAICSENRRFERIVDS